MSTPVDELTIEIDAKAQNANSAIDNLCKKMDRLTTSLSKVDGNKLSGLANSIHQLGMSIQTMSNFNSDNLNNVVKTFAKLSKIEYSKLNNAGNGLAMLSQGMSTLGTIGNLSNITPAVNAIKNLARTDLSGFDTGKMQTIASTLSSFANQIGTTTKIEASVTKIISAMARLSNSGQYIGNVSAYFPVLGQHVTALVQNLSGAGAIDIGVAKVVDGIARLASAGNKVGITVANLQALGDGVVKLVNRLNTLPRVNANIANLILGLGNIASSGTRAGSVVGGLSTRLNTFSKSANVSSKKAFSLASAIGKLYATYWMLFRAFGVLKKAINVSGSLTEVQNVVVHTFGTATEKVNEQAKNAIYTLGMSELSFKKYASTYQSMAMAMGITSQEVKDANSFLDETTDGYVKASDELADVSLNVTKLAGDLASFYDKDQADVAEDLQSIFTGMVVPLRKYGLDLTQATLKEWAMSQGIDANVESMTQAEKTMLRYQYVMSQTTMAQGDFTRTADTWNNQVRLLSENFTRLGVIWGNAGINMLKPLLNALNKGMDAVITFSENVVNALGAIFGWKLEIQRGLLADDFEDAASGAADLSDGIGSANDNAKKLKNQLQGFDELNVLNTQGNKTGGGGSNGLLDASTANNNRLKFDIIEDEGLYKSSIRDLEELGEYINNTLTKTLKDIDWESVYDGAKNFGTGLADFLNGLISPELFGVTGKTVAGALNTAIYAALSFGQTFDFDDLGSSIAQGINDFFDTFDFKDFASTIKVWVKGLKNTIIIAIAEINWGDVLLGIGEILSSLDAETIAILFAFGTLSSLFKSGLFNTLATSLTGISVLPATLTASLGTLSSLIFKGFVGSLGAAFAGWNIGNAIYEYIADDDISDIDWKSYFVGEDKATAEEWIYAIKEYVTHDIIYFDDNSNFEAEFDSVLSEYKGAIKDFKNQTGIDLNGKNKATISFLLKNTRSFDWYVNALSNMGFAVDDLTDLIGNDVAKTVGSTEILAKSLKDDVGGAITYIADDLIDKKFIKGNNNIMSSTLSLVGNVTAGYNSAFQRVGSILMSLTNSVGNASETLKNKTISMFEEAHKSIKNSYSSIINDVGYAVSTVNTKISNSIATTSATVGSALSAVNASTNNTLANIVSAANTKTGELSKGATANLNNMLNIVGQYMSSALNTIQSQNWYNSGVNLVGGLINGISAKWGVGGAANTLTSKIVSLASNLTGSLKKAFGIHSPSKIWEEEIGRYLSQGLEVGILGEEDNLIGSVANMGKRLTDSFDSSLVLTTPRTLSSDYDFGTIGTMSHQFSAGGAIISDIAQGVKDGMYSSQAEQNALLREQNNLLLQILDKEGISIDDVYSGVVNRNRDNINRTGLNPLMTY